MDFGKCGERLTCPEDAKAGQAPGQEAGHEDVDMRDTVVVVEKGKGKGKGKAKGKASDGPKRITVCRRA